MHDEPAPRSRWSLEQVVAVAPSPAAYATAEPLAEPARWPARGADARAVWGRCGGSGREPYDTAVDHVEARWSCSCPSRRRPCKHALALLVLWVRGQVPDAAPPEAVVAWIRRADARAGTGSGAPASRAGDRAGGPDPGSDAGADSGAGADAGADPPAPTEAPADRDRARDERVARLYAGLIELDRWLHDRLRAGLADPALARYATWDALAARLVDARAGALANRVRRLAGLVGASADWHARVLTEIGLLHLLAQAGQRVGELPGHLADAVAIGTGWQVRQADVLAGVPETDHWVVAGRSDTREDRIEVRRTWLRGRASGRWAMVLAFAAYGQSLDDSLEVGTEVPADLFRYPGGSLRALLGARHGDPERPPAPAATPPALEVEAACDAIGQVVSAEPWIERMAATVSAAPTIDAGRWVLTDDTGSLPVLEASASGAPGGASAAALLAASRGAPVPITVEWTPHGVIPLTVHLPDRALDLGPRADPSFLGAPA